jgi:hypothetical protein
MHMISEHLVRARHRSTHVQYIIFMYNLHNTSTHLTLATRHHVSAAIPIFAAVLITLTLVALASAGLTDPGIIPRGHRAEVADSSGEIPAFVLRAVWMHCIECPC